MGENSKIEWTDHTWNPWIGCQKVSAACDNCYAEDMMDKRYGRVKWGPHGERQRTSAGNWQKPIAWDRRAAREGIRYRVFCASLADVFDNKVPKDWRRDLFKLIRKTKRLDWLLLTKRPQNIAKMLPPDWMDGYRNVWLGVSAEDQEQWDKRLEILAKVAARIRFVSVEPMLGDIDVGNAFDTAIPTNSPYGVIHWVICGGESGRNARPVNPNWVRSLRDQCKLWDIPFLFKQWGEFGPLSGSWEDRGNAVLRLGKANSGRLLDGVEWTEFPQ